MTGCECAALRHYKWVTSQEDARIFMINCLVAVGTPKKYAEIVAENLLDADSKGIISHGMNRLRYYITDIQNKACDPCAEPTKVHETVCSAVVDGHNGLGEVVGSYCMNLAIEKAKQTGIGIVVARGSNHFGINGYYSYQAIKQGVIGLCFTNTSPLMVPTRAKKAALGTNPLAVGAPALNGDIFLLDMTTTTIALGKLEIYRRRGQKLPSGWALNDKGEDETDAEEAMKYRLLTPLGGTESNAGYKGFGLAIFVEVLTGLLSGAAYGPNIRSWDKDNQAAANLGHGFIAIDPAAFEPGFETRLSDLMNFLRKLEPADPEKPVLIPGDTERQQLAKVADDGGIIYLKDQHDTNAQLAKELKVAPLKSKWKKVRRVKTCRPKSKKQKCTEDCKL